MTSQVWQPLSARLAGRGALREGVPVVLRQPLRDWIRSQAYRRDDLVGRIRVRLDLTRDAMSDEEPEPHIWLAYETRDKDLLDIADALLSFPPRSPLASLGNEWTKLEVKRRKDSLQELLDDARSLYTVRVDGFGLERRAGVIASRAYAKAAQTATEKPDAGSAVGHLQAAWAAAYGLKPDPVRAYSEAIKAVEAAAHAVADPGNPKATLGTMIRQFRDRPHAFSVVLGGQSAVENVVSVTAMMSMLWSGQTSRHGGKMPTRIETVGEAQAAVHLAVTLVEWFASGAVRKG